MRTSEVDPQPEPFDPATACHRDDPLIGGDPDGACSSIQPCKLRCHIRWLDGQTQPNDSFADAPSDQAGGA